MASSLDRVRIAILGASGYTGAELLRILAHHPMAEIVALTADRQVGKKIGAVFPHLARRALSRRWICRPVVPASPSMNTFGAISNPRTSREMKRGASIGTEAPPRAKAVARQRFENWKLRRALARPYFLRSTTRLSRVRNPPCFSSARSAGS